MRNQSFRVIYVGTHNEGTISQVNLDLFYITKFVQLTLRNFMTCSLYGYCIYTGSL